MVLGNKRHNKRKVPECSETKIQASGDGRVSKNFEIPRIQPKYPCQVVSDVPLQAYKPVPFRIKRGPFIGKEFRKFPVLQFR